MVDVQAIKDEIGIGIGHDIQELRDLGNVYVRTNPPLSSYLLTLADRLEYRVKMINKYLED